MKLSILVICIAYGLTACSNPAPQESAVNQSASTESPLPDTAPVSVVAKPSTNNSASAKESISGFKQELDSQGAHFIVEATDDGSLNSLTVTSSGLGIVSDKIIKAIDGTVTKAEVADLDNNGSPEIYVFINSAGSGSYGSFAGYAVNKGKSLTEITLPAIANDFKNNKGYMGHDEFAVLEGVLVQRFPIYNVENSNATPSGKTRQLQYKFNPAETSWLLKLDRVAEY